MGLPVVGALVHDATSGYQSIGMGCTPDPHHAMVKALARRCNCGSSSPTTTTPTAPSPHAATRPGSPLKPWRAARDYANTYRPDLSDAVDCGCHLQLHLDPSIQHRFQTELDASTAGEVDLADLAADAPTGLTETVTRLATLGHQVLAVDVTTDDVRTAGLHVTRVLVPG